MAFRRPKRYLAETRKLLEDLEEQMEAESINAEEAGFIMGYSKA